MVPLQTLADPAMAVVVLGVLLSIVVPLAFLWAFKKISEPPETEAEEDSPDRGTVGL